MWRPFRAFHGNPAPPGPIGEFITASDCRQWSAIGNHVEANEELERITPSLRAHPDMLEVRWHIYAHAKKWEVCAEIAGANPLYGMLPCNLAGKPPIPSATNSIIAAVRICSIP